MNKSDLAGLLHKKYGLTVRQANGAVTDLFTRMGNSLRKGESIQIMGFGTFGRKRRKGRTGRNPQTGETLRIPARRVVTFKAHTALKEAINK